MKGVLMIDVTGTDRTTILVCVCEEPLCICVHIEQVKKDT